MRKLSIILLWGLLALKGISQTNEGTDFWFAFLEHRDVGQNTMVVMISSLFNTSGTIEIPKRNWKQSFSVSANEVTIITLPSFAETIGSELITTTGINIKSNLPVSVYIHQYHSFRSEAAVVLPIPSLGNEYYAMTYQGVNWNGTDYPSEFLLVATEDETEIFIELSDGTARGKTANSSFSVQLDAGETYQVQGKDGSSDLTGTHLIGDKNFAVFAGNTWTEVPLNCGLRDNLMEQMYPVATWGRQFVSVPNANISYDTFRLLASKNNTQIRIQRPLETQNYTLDAGEFVEFNSGDAAFIRASQPILVAQFNVGANCSGYNLGDPSMVLLNSIEQTLDTVTLFNSSFQQITENYINIIFKTSDRENVVFDGQALSDATNEIFDLTNADFSYARVRVNSGSHTISSKGCGIIATAYGYGEAESYAYSGGARFSPINTDPIVDGGCLNDTITFDAGLSPKRYSFEWNFGDGEILRTPIVKRIYDELGSYPVQLIITDDCLLLSDTFQKEIQVTLRQAVDAIDFLQICEGESFILNATDVEKADYVWKGPNQFFAEVQSPSLVSAQTTMSGTYSVIGTVSGCATFPAFTEVEVTKNPEPNLGLDTLICTRGDTFNLVLNPGLFEQYEWQNGSQNTTFEVVEEGEYWVQVTDQFGCTGKDEVNFKLRCPTSIFAPNIFSPNGLKGNQEFTVFADQVINAELLIFDRWGSLIFNSETPNLTWDGRFKDKVATQGSYVWLLKFDGYRETGSIYSDTATGTVTLIR